MKRRRRARLAAQVFLVADLCIVGIVAPVILGVVVVGVWMDEVAIAVVIAVNVASLLGVIAFVAASAYVFLRRRIAAASSADPDFPARFGEGRRTRVFAWLTLVVVGAWIAYVGIGLGMMMAYYDGQN